MGATPVPPHRHAPSSPQCFCFMGVGGRVTPQTDWADFSRTRNAMFVSSGCCWLEPLPGVEPGLQEAVAGLSRNHSNLKTSRAWTIQRT